MMQVDGSQGTARTWRGMAMATGVVTAVLLHSACAPVSAKADGAEATPEAVPMKSAPCVKAIPKPYQWEGYNDQLKDACVGPHHFRFPANMFRDQMGPDFQGNFTLVLMWPDLQPAPPGKLNGQPFDQVMARVQISPDYVDRVPIETLLERFTHMTYGGDSERDPSSVLALRDRQADRFGLTPYYVNAQRFEDFQTEQNRRLGMKGRGKVENTSDWYLQRDDAGRLITFIRCDSHLKPDGYTARNGTLVKNPNERTNAQCVHHFVMEDMKADVSIDYPRALLGEWKRFEDRARAMLVESRVP